MNHSPGLLPERIQRGGVCGSAPRWDHTPRRTGKDTTGQGERKPRAPSRAALERNHNRMVTATTFAAARPILQAVFPGFPVPVVLLDDDPREALIDELDSLIADLEAALAERDAAHAIAATLESRCSVIGERLGLVRAALMLA